MSPARIPVVFSAPRSIQRLNVAAVATSIATCTAATTLAISRGWQWTLLTGVPTLMVACAWALCLRWQRESPKGNRWGWFLSVPFAAVNSAVACAALCLHQTGWDWLSFVGGLICGATFGVVVWLPALCAVLVLFGIPLARAQFLARRGLAGEERGERTVGIAAAVLGACAMALAWASPLPLDPSRTDVLFGVLFFNALGIAAIASGSLAAVRSTARERRRRRFIERVEALEEPGYRVEPTPVGKVLVRVAPVTTYRVSDRAEELFELDDAGRATHSVMAGR